MRWSKVTKSIRSPTSPGMALVPTAAGSMRSPAKRAGACLPRQSGSTPPAGGAAGHDEQGYRRYRYAGGDDLDAVGWYVGQLWH